MKLKFWLPLIALLIFSCSTSDDTPIQSGSQNGSNTGDNMNNNPGGGDSGTFMVGYQGDFMSSAHETSGIAEINTEGTILRLENFSTENGPLLELYLTTDLSAETYVSLGELQGLQGDFDYTLPSNINFNIYKYVIVWCVDFSVNFGYAELE